MKNIIIIGAGTAGLTSALYGARANRKVLVLDGVLGGGECGKIARLDNYPGVESVDGLSLLFTMKKQAKDAGADFVSKNAISVDCKNLVVSTSKETYKCKTIILATGCKAQKLGLNNEKELIGNGISYCATCDGALFKNKEVALVGNGKKAMADVEYLSAIASKVYHITDDEYENKENVEIVKGKIVELVSNPLQSIKLDTGLTIFVPVLFVNIGYFPETSLIASQVDSDNKGYIITDENMKTSVDGVYAVGDVRKKQLRQVVTACADGAIAVESAIRRK